MLSYQHSYHAGNLADVQKHALLAWMLDYLMQKDKPISYIETHAGRGLYDLTAPEALKTGEAASGIARLSDRLPADHPYRHRLAEIRARHGATAYPGSPLIAALALRDTDTMHLAELHPTEHHALTRNLTQWGAHIQQRDGFDMALAICPPTPRRGLMLIDPSYEVKSDYDRIAKLITQLNRKWNVGIIALWYPVLTDAPHGPMLAALQAAFPNGLRSEVTFPPARIGHRMTGSGLFTLNAPYGMADEATRIATLIMGP
ncbi:MAG: 23S rRNA (adenine(2030)-N(6))-methyltransferase RlmJ [Alphaproteobacteria bacterium]|jgi:23S rRNA (adenine2030-N6)-methyltransferase